MISKASSTSTSIICCCLFMIWMIVVSPVLSARKLSTTPSSGGPTKIGAGRNDHQKGGSAIPSGPKTATNGTTVITKSAYAEITVNATDCSPNARCKRGGKP
ncbi:uncharacterized protein LOC132294740 [Cornus florida]|uniref:uncharacterized protein LOC132294740 n=1 Tax=Cornus florida TaxID=4283 RepID=UPI0028A0EE7D|nr:uncharacterized protein LOC132294740 [Cornus florida]